MMKSYYFGLRGADGSVGGYFRARQAGSGLFDEWFDPNVGAWEPDRWGYVARFLRGDPDGMPMTEADVLDAVSKLSVRDASERNAVVIPSSQNEKDVGNDAPSEATKGTRRSR